MGMPEPVAQPIMAAAAIPEVLKMISELRSLGYQVEPLSVQPA
jgi:hypothetical protein